MKKNTAISCGDISTEFIKTEVGKKYYGAWQKASDVYAKMCDHHQSLYECRKNEWASKEELDAMLDAFREEERLAKLDVHSAFNDYKIARECYESTMNNLGLIDWTTF